MITLMDWLVQLEHSRSALSHTRQERFARMVRSKERFSKQAKISVNKSEAETKAAPVRCCPEATA